ncbi:MAG TPA: hypothetical protein PLW68_01560 [Casimicrobiaceae bacterium]|nr:hypothetical protein [Casimicrobiaceae bacterium]
MDNLAVAIAAGLLGMAYFVYGKRQSKFVPVIAGVLLCVLPYITANLTAQLVVGGVLLAAPFVIDY